MTIHQILIDSEQQPGHWYTALRYLREVTDWSYFTQRALCLAPAKSLAFLLYARDSGAPVPDTAIAHLRDAPD